MNDMNKFHKLLSAYPEGRTAYLQALTLFTKLSPAQLVQMTNGLDWQMW